MYSYWRFKNFKALRSVRLELKPFTVIIGQNNTGKSSAYHPLLLLQSWLRGRTESRHASPSIPASLHSLFGSMRDLVWMKRPSTPISIEVGIKTSGDDRATLNDLVALDPYFASRDYSELRYRLDIYGPNDRPWDIHLQGIYDADGEPIIETRREYVYHDRGASATQTHRPDLFSEGFENWLLDLERQRGNPDLADSLAPLLKLLDRQFTERTRILIEARTGPAWIETINDRKPRSVGYGGEQLMNYLSFHYNDRAFLHARKRLNHWLGRFGGTELLISLDQYDANTAGTDRGRLGAFGTVDDDTLGLSLNLTAMGYGFKQLLTVCVECFFSPPGSTVVIDEPELHLHPDYQMQLVDMLIEVVNAGKQLILITHSENIFLRLQRRLAETAARAPTSTTGEQEGGGRGPVISAEDVTAYHFTKDAAGVAVEPLTIEPDGRIPGWLPGITDAFEREMSAIVAAHRGVARQRDPDVCPVRGSPKSPIRGSSARTSQHLPVVGDGNT